MAQVARSLYSYTARFGGFSYEQNADHPRRIEKTVASTLKKQPIVGHAHPPLPPTFGTPDPTRPASRSRRPASVGLDELLTYHYLVAEVYRIVPATKLPYEEFWKMPKTAQADHIWKHVFVERTPISEACRGVLTCLHMLGLDAARRNCPGCANGSPAGSGQIYRPRDGPLECRKHHDDQPVFDDNERARWLKDAKTLRGDPRFKPVLRIDPILRNWPLAAKKLTEWGFDAGDGVTLTDKNIEEGRRFLREWLDRQQAIYMALSLPPEFRYPAESADPAEKAGQIALEKIVLPWPPSAACPSP